MSFRLALFFTLIATLFAGCGSDSDGDGDPCNDPNVVCECVGDLTIEVTVPGGIPDKLRVIYGAEVAVDECDESRLNYVLIERREGVLLINDGGFGYTPPPEFTLELIDLGDCDAERSILSVTGHPVGGGPFESCSSADAFLEAETPRPTSCEPCLADGGTWQPDARACTTDCALQDVSCFADACPAGCDECLATGGTWQPEANECTTDCALQDISCFATACPGACEDDCSNCFSETECIDAGCAWNRAGEAAWCVGG